MLLSFEDSGGKGRSVPGGQVPWLPVSKCRVECLLEALSGAITRSHLLVGQADSKDRGWHWEVIPSVDLSSSAGLKLTDIPLD